MLDDPNAFLEAARAQLEALRDDTPKEALPLRQAAETAHLALSPAVEIATGKAINRGRDEFDRVQMISKRIQDPAFPKSFEKLRLTLYGKCFHGAECSRSDVLVALGEAKAMTERILRCPRKPRELHK
jgi:hypothetical protein